MTLFGHFLTSFWTDKWQLFLPSVFLRRTSILVTCGGFGQRTALGLPSVEHFEKGKTGKFNPRNARLALLVNHLLGERFRCDVHQHFLGTQVLGFSPTLSRALKTLIFIFNPGCEDVANFFTVHKVFEGQVAQNVAQHLACLPWSQHLMETEVSPSYPCVQADFWRHFSSWLLIGELCTHLLFVVDLNRLSICCTCKSESQKLLSLSNNKELKGNQIFDATGSNS